MVVNGKYLSKCGSEIITEKNCENVKHRNFINDNSENNSPYSAQNQNTPSTSYQHIDEHNDREDEYPLDLQLKNESINNIGNKSSFNNVNQEQLLDKMNYKHSLTNLSNECSQIKLITMASGHVLRKKDADDLWTRSRSLLRKNTGTALKAKSSIEYHRNNFHLSLKHKWSKVMTNKISALAFSKSLQDRHHPVAFNRS